MIISVYGFHFIRWPGNKVGVDQLGRNDQIIFISPFHLLKIFALNFMWVLEARGHCPWCWNRFFCVGKVDRKNGTGF